MDHNHPQSFVGFDHTIQGILDYLEHLLPGYPFLTATDTLFVEELQRDFPHLDILKEIKTFRWYFDDDLSSKKRTHRVELESTSPNRSDATLDEPELTSKHRAALRKRWANLIRRVHKTDPLLCACGGKFVVISFITEPKVIRRILDHLDKQDPRAPPSNNLDSDSASS